ncbi:MAG: helix-turn-helix domain-containing protein [Bilifractor sp.]
MLPLYTETKNNLQIELRPSVHVSPHLHKSLEFVFVTKGTLELGVGENLYHMSTGDLGVIFPELIHHYQVFDDTECEAYYLLASPSMADAFGSIMKQKSPEVPVIAAGDVHPDIRYALDTLYSLEQDSPFPFKRRMEESSQDRVREVLQQAYVNVIMARCLPCMTLVDKDTVGSDDIIYRMVSYITGKFREPLTMTRMAHDLGISPYALSRIFSGTFHRNFNQYLNEVRLEYAAELLHRTDEPITDICMDVGFGSQRTFNRVFMDHFHTSPREFRNHQWAADAVRSKTTDWNR